MRFYLSNTKVFSFFISNKYYLYAFLITTLFYLPYLFITIFSEDALTGNFYSCGNYFNIIESMKGWLFLQMKPFYTLSYVIFDYFCISPRLQSIFGMLCLFIANLGLTKLFFPQLDKKYQAILIALMSLNPFLLYESLWHYQFFLQMIVFLFYFGSFYLLNKDLNNRSVFKRLSYRYLIPIVVGLFGSLFYMPSLFLFIALGFIFILKNHLQNPFKNIKEIFIREYNIIIVLAIIVVIFGSISLVLEDIVMQTHTSARRLNLSFIQRIIKFGYFYIPTYFYLAIICFSILFLSLKKNIMNGIFYFGSLCILFISYFPFFIKDLISTNIIGFTAYYLLICSLGFLLIYHKKYSIRYSILPILILFYGSYFQFYRGYITQDLIKKSFIEMTNFVEKKDKPIIWVGERKDYYPLIIKDNFIINKYIIPNNHYSLSLYKNGIQGGNFGYPLINLCQKIIHYGCKVISNFNKEELLEIDKRVNEIQNKGIKFPQKESLFEFKGYYIIVGDKVN